MATILIADEDATLLDVLRTTLASAGHTVVTASDEREARHVLHKLTVHCLLLDSSLLEVNGARLVRTIRKHRRYRKMKLGLLTHREWEAQMLQEGGLQPDVLLRKPVGTTDVLEAIQLMAVGPYGPRIGARRSHRVFRAGRALAF